MTLAPYMPPHEWEQIVSAFRSVSPRRILEWGCGGSTVEIEREFPEAEIHSVEHDLEWAQRVREATGSRVTVHVSLPPETAKGWEWRAEQDPEFMPGYLDAANDRGPFDAVLIDGRARRFCILRAQKLLRPGGVAVLHDAERRYYWDVLPSRFEMNGRVCMFRK